ncbi:MAG: CHRD domain-containing protein [Bacteroidota bacterium]|nr:CHRD domain-containing protein [Bacteroidota bacterium]
MKILTLVFRIFLGLVLIFMVQKDSSATIYIINNVLNGQQESPPVTTSGTGTIVGTYNSTTRVISFTITFSGLIGITSAGHFHGPANPGSNAGVIIGYGGFPPNVSSGSYSNTYTLTVAQDTMLLNGRVYSNVHTNFRPGGEIRGQILPYTLDLTTLIEGFYNDASNTMVRDTVTVNLRSATTPFPLVASSKVYLSTSGTGSLSYPDASNGASYYLQILHRNGLETWSATPTSFSTFYMTYDFTTNASQAFGSNLTLKGSEYCIFSGDVNQDGIVDLSDLQLVDNDAFNFLGGYVNTDVNGDEVVDVSDAGIAENNSVDFVSVMRP